MNMVAYGLFAGRMAIIIKNGKTKEYIIKENMTFMIFQEI